MLSSFVIFVCMAALREGYDFNQPKALLEVRIIVNLTKKIYFWDWFELTRIA